MSTRQWFEVLSTVVELLANKGTEHQRQKADHAIVSLVGLWLAANHHELSEEIGASAQDAWAHLLEEHDAPFARLTECAQLVLSRAMPQDTDLLGTITPNFVNMDSSPKDASTLRRIILKLDRMEKPNEPQWASFTRELFLHFPSSESREATNRRELNALLAGLATRGRDIPNAVYDPACGECGTLVAVIEQLRASGHKEMPRLYGQDTNPDALYHGAWALLLNGARDFRLALGDVLTSPKFHEGTGELEIKTFDVVISSPPLNLRVNQPADTFESDPYRRYAFGPVPSSSTWLFVQHALASSTSGGIVVITASPADLNRPRSADIELRSNLVHAGVLSKVVLVPGGFLSHRTTLQCAVLVLQRENRPRSDILFVDGTHVFDERLSPSLASIGSTLLDEAFEPSPTPHVAATVGAADIRDNEYALSPERYVPLPSLLEELPDYRLVNHALQEHIADLARAQSRFLETREKVEARLRK